VKSPQMEHFAKLKEYYKWQQLQQANFEKMELRAKKKTPGILMTKTPKLNSKFTIEDLECQKQEKIEEVAALANLSFNELYSRCVQIKMEEENQSTYSESVKDSMSYQGATPKEATGKMKFNFGD
jgi:hypothetical protein